MRTTITIDEELLQRLKLRAASEHTTISALIEQDVRSGELPRAQRERTERSRFEPPTFDLGDPAPAVDLTDNAALLEFLESDE